MNCPICKVKLNREFGENVYGYKCDSLHYEEFRTPLLTVTKVGNKEMDINIAEPSKKRWSKLRVIERWVRKERKEWVENNE